MEFAEIFQRVGTALGLGFVVGLQRERIGSVLAGIRTFPLISALGILCGLASPYAIAAGLLGLAAVIVAGAIQFQDTKNPGLTTHIAMLVMFGVGAALASQPIAPIVALGGAVAVLLHLKAQLHGFASKLGDQDFKAIMQFVAVSLVILPTLPNRYFGPYDVLNPQRLWLTVVLIVGISLAGFLVYRWFGDRAGTLAAGLLGGLISSTATTVSYARRTKAEAGASTLAAIIIMLASSVVFARVLMIITATAPTFLPAAALPIAVMLVATAAASAALWKRRPSGAPSMAPQENPAQVKTALLFTVIYGVVLVAVAFARSRLGSSGLYLVSILSGLTDMDAITLSVSQMVQDGRLPAASGWRMIVAASLANLAFKAGVVSFLGSRDLFKRIASGFGATAVVGIGMILLWP